MQVSSTRLLPGQTVQNYHMTVTNLGPDADVELRAPVPAASVIEASPDTGSYDAGTWNLGTLETGTTASLDLTARN